MNQQVKLLISSLKEAFSGQTWYGISLMNKINTIDWQIVNKTPFETANSVAKLIKHCINWRIFTIEKLHGNTVFDIELNTIADWTDITINSQQEWLNLTTELKNSQQQLVDILSNKNDAFLAKTTPGKPYNYHYLIEGIIQHDIYHLGQIGIIEKLAKNNYS